MSLLTPFRGTFVYAPLYAKCLEHLQANEHLKNTKTSQNNAELQTKAITVSAVDLRIEAVRARMTRKMFDEDDGDATEQRAPADEAVMGTSSVEGAASGRAVRPTSLSMSPLNTPVFEHRPFPGLPLDNTPSLQGSPMSFSALLQGLTPVSSATFASTWLTSPTASTVISDAVTSSAALTSSTVSNSATTARVSLDSSENELRLAEQTNVLPTQQTVQTSGLAFLAEQASLLPSQQTVHTIGLPLPTSASVTVLPTATDIVALIPTVIDAELASPISSIASWLSGSSSSVCQTAVTSPSPLAATSVSQTSTPSILQSSSSSSSMPHELSSSTTSKHTVYSREFAAESREFAAVFDYQPQASTSRCLQPQQRSASTSHIERGSPASLPHDVIAQPVSKRSHSAMEADAACLLLDGPSLDAAINMIVKEEIKDKVTKRMRVHGKEPTAEYKQQKPEQLSQADIEQRERRKERNKLAAQKCRDKRRLLQEALEKETQELSSSNQELRRQIRALELEKQRLEYSMMRHDVRQQQCPHQTQLIDPSALAAAAASADAADAAAAASSSGASTAGVNEDLMMLDIPSVTSSSDQSACLFSDDVDDDTCSDADDMIDDDSNR